MITIRRRRVVVFSVVLRSLEAASSREYFRHKHKDPYDPCQASVELLVHMQFTIIRLQDSGSVVFPFTIS